MWLSYSQTINFKAKKLTKITLKNGKIKVKSEIPFGRKGTMIVVGKLF